MTIKEILYNKEYIASSDYLWPYSSLAALVFIPCIIKFTAIFCL